MKRRTITIIGIIIIIGLVLVLILLFGKGKGENSKNGNNVGSSITHEMKQVAVDYMDRGNNQGNDENGGSQTYITDGRILLRGDLDEGNSRMLYFNVEGQVLQLACDKSNCLHNDQNCISNQGMTCLQSYGTIVFGISDRYTKEIWKCENDEVSCLFKSDDDIDGLWGYAGYLYYKTNFGVYRINIKDGKNNQKVLDKPVAGGELTFDKDKMYYCGEDEILYQANLDGSKEKRMCDEMAAFPQIWNERLYYRSMEYNKSGMFECKNTLCSIELDGSDKKVVLDTVYQYNILADGIYYTKLPIDGETALYHMDVDGKKQRKIVDCAEASLYIFEETDWILFKKTEGELPADQEEGAKPTHLYCIKKDGSQEKRLDYPQIIKE